LSESYNSLFKCDMMLILITIFDQLFGGHFFIFNFILVFWFVELIDIKVDLTLLLETVEWVHGTGVIVLHVPDTHVEFV